MNSSNMLSRQGHRLLQAGVALLLFASLEGLAIPFFTVPHLGLSVHSLSASLGVLLLALGLLWPSLNLGSITSRIAFGFLIYFTLAILAAYLMAGIWGAGHSTMPLAAGAARGSAFQEAVIKVMAYSSAPPGIISFALILWGLRGKATSSLMKGEY